MLFANLGCGFAALCSSWLLFSRTSRIADILRCQLTSSPEFLMIVSRRIRRVDHVS
jgi:hypothetical protein